jgi:hypothetical protein
MCLIVIPSNTLTKLVAAAQAVQSLVDDETLSKAYVHSDEEAQAQSVAALDKLAECAAGALAEHKDVSPFIRYRKEVLDEFNLTAKSLRRLVLNLWNGMEGLNLSALFWNADPLHARIALDMIASYSQRGEKDAAFMALAREIRDRFAHELGDVA